MHQRIKLYELRTLLFTAGKIISSAFHHKVDFASKFDGSPVTQADLAVDAFLKQQLTRLFPQASYLSEESPSPFSTADGKTSSPWVWIVDPLDGTKEFIQRIPELAISVGLVHEGKVVLGAVHNPITLEGAAARQGGERTFWGLSQLKAEAPKSLAQATASISRSENADKSIHPYLSLFRTHREVGSVAYKLLRVAAGVEDFTLSVQPKSEWDVCGGAALLEFTGKTYRRLDGLPLQFAQANPRINSAAAAGTKALVEELLSYWPQLSAGNTSHKKAG